jgi:hypothetical protein
MRGRDNMSGGHFDYQEGRIRDIGYSIETIIEDNHSKRVDDWGYTVGREYPASVIEKFQDALDRLRLVYDDISDIDYLLCDDTGPESFEACWNKRREEAKYE